jgi:hypothetical protein
VVNHRGLSLDVIGNPGNWFFPNFGKAPRIFGKVQKSPNWKVLENVRSLSLSDFFFNG